MKTSKPKPKAGISSLRNTLDGIIDEYRQSSNISQETLDDLKFLIDDFLSMDSFALIDNYTNDFDNDDDF